MATYRDLDQSGSYRTIVVAMGPTIGNTRVPVSLESFFAGPGNYTIQPWDCIIIVRQTLSAPCSILLPKASIWQNAVYGGSTLIVKDGAGVAGANPITLSPFAGDIIEGPSVISVNLGALQLVVLPDLSGWSTITSVSE